MDNILHISKVFTIFTFFYYGLSCLFTPGMRLEFERYGLSKLRILTGVLQLLLSAGLVIGLTVTYFTIISSLGLSIMMLVAFYTRVRIKDSVAKALPALFYFVVNFAIFCFEFFKFLS